MNGCELAYDGFELDNFLQSLLELLRPRDPLRAQRLHVLLHLVEAVLPVAYLPLSGLEGLLSLLKLDLEPSLLGFRLPLLHMQGAYLEEGLVSLPLHALVLLQCKPDLLLQVLYVAEILDGLVLHAFDLQRLLIDNGLQLPYLCLQLLRSRVRVVRGHLLLPMHLLYVLELVRQPAPEYQGRRADDLAPEGSLQRLMLEVAGLSSAVMRFQLSRGRVDLLRLLRTSLILGEEGALGGDQLGVAQESMMVSCCRNCGDGLVLEEELDLIDTLEELLVLGFQRFYVTHELVMLCLFILAVHVVFEEALTRQLGEHLTVLDHAHGLQEPLKPRLVWIQVLHLHVINGWLGGVACG